MKRPAVVFPILVLFAALSAAPAHAWGKLGHRLVATLAADDLTPQARAEVDLLLAGEAEPTLAGISTWADVIRANDPVLGKRSAPWHYVRVRADDCKYMGARDCAGGDCVVGAIEAQTAILADRGRPLEARRQALKFVVHFIGDVHQPLHAGRRDDRGGNDLQLRVPTPGGGERGGNLHSFWDSGLIELAGLDESAYLAKLRSMSMAVALPRDPLPPPAGDWATQSCRISDAPGFYPASRRPEPGYPAAWTPVADAQMLRAGARLAQVLNAALGR